LEEGSPGYGEGSQLIEKSEIRVRFDCRWEEGVRSREDMDFTS